MDPSKLKPLLQNILIRHDTLQKNSPSPVEVELRLNGPISIQGFYRVLNSLSNVTITHQVIHQFPNDIRSITNPDTGTVIWERKRKDRPFDFPDLGFRIGLSTEEQIAPVTDNILNTRNKTLYQSIEGNFRYDLAQVNNEYEIEIEYIGTTLRQDLPKLLSRGIEVIQIHDDSELFMTQGEKKNVITLFNRLLGHPGDLLRRVFNAPVDLHYRDLTADVMLKNPYSITAKADGIRKLLFGVRRGGLYFVTSGGVSKIAEKNLVDKDFIVDGELVGNKFYMFDVLYYELSLSDKLLTTRLNYRDKLPKRMPITLKGDSLELVLLSKPFYYFKTADEFFSAVDRVMKETQFEIDGLVFTPVNPGYYQGTIFKWKPVEKLTIDFQVMKQDPGIGVKNRDNVVVPFKGTASFPITSRDVVSEGYQIGDIVEFAYRDGKWIGIRLREDKIEPNFEKVATDILGILENPILLQTLLGQDLVLMRKYHNRVKAKLYGFLSEAGVSSLVDLGAGRGGDVLKWKTGGFQVTAVEPNMDNLRELERRVEEAGLTSVNIVHSRAEDFSCSTPVDAVTMFHSLTFFYDDPKHVDQLVNIVDNCVKSGGFFVVMAVDGEKLRENFPKDHQGPMISIKYVEGGVIVNIENSIVNTQREFLTNFRDLVARLKNFTIVQDFYLDDELFLTQEGLLYSRSTHVVVAQKKKGGTMPILGLESYPIVTEPRGRQVALVGRKEKLTRLLVDDVRPLGVTIVGRKDWMRIGVIGDTSTLLHAILSTFSPTYLELDPQGRREFVLDLRRQLGITDPTYSLSVEDLPLLMNELGVNVYLTNLTDYNLLPLEGYQPGRESILIYWNDVDVFEPLGLPLKGNEIKTVFFPQDRVL